MADYRNIKTLKDLEAAQKSLDLQLSIKGDQVSGSIYGVKETLSPATLAFNGFRALNNFLPMDKILLTGVLKLKRHLLK